LRAHGFPYHALSAFALLSLAHKTAFTGELRKTVNTYAARAARGKYSGVDLREIRSTGQARECARRRRQLCQHWRTP
jgi:hypothetical protein